MSGLLRCDMGSVSTSKPRRQQVLRYEHTFPTELLGCKEIGIYDYYKSHTVMHMSMAISTILNSHYYSTHLGLGMRRYVVTRNSLFSTRNTVPAVLANVVGVGQHIESILLLVRLALVEPEQHTTDKRQDGNGSVVPDEQRVLGQRDESLANGVGKGRHKVPVGRNQRPHVLGGLCKGEFETRDRGEDFRETNQDVGHGLHPYVDGRGLVARVHELAAGTALVDVVLDDGGRDHGQGPEDEAKGHALDGRKVNVCLAQGGVQEVVDNRDEDDERDGVQVGDDVVGYTVQRHSGSLGDEVVVHLVVRQPC